VVDTGGFSDTLGWSAVIDVSSAWFDLLSAY